MMKTSVLLASIGVAVSLTPSSIATAAAPAEVWGVSTLSAHGGIAGTAPLAATDGSGNLFVVATQGDRSRACIVTLKYRGSDGAVAWRREACGTFFTFGRAIAVDAAGDVIVAGSTTGDTRIIKYAGADGAVRWDQQPGNASGYDAANAIAIDAAGDVYALGFVAVPDPELQVLKLAGATGALAWRRAIDNGREDTPIAIAVDGGGNVTVASHFLNTRGDEDWHVARLSALGATLWQRNLDSGRRDVAVGLALDAAGNAYVAGNSAASASQDVIRTVRFEAASGAVAWQQTYGSSGFNGASAVIADAQGNVIVGGHAAVTTGDDDMVTLKYSSAGTLAWQSRFAGTRAGLENVRALALDGNGNVVVTGISFTQGHPSSDIRTAKYNGATGGEIWTSAYRAGGGEDSGHAVASTGGATYAVGVATENAVPMLRVAKFGDTSAAAPDGVNVQGLWWNGPAESGWGINLTQQGGLLFATWFTYDTDGQGMWLVMSRGERTGLDIYSGDLYRTQGPPAAGGRFDPSQVSVTAVGRATFAFTDDGNGRVDASVNGTAISKRITRQVFSPVQTSCTADTVPGASPNYQALWWAAPAGVESGWGLNLAQQGETIFATWFTYGADGRGRWLVASNVARVSAGIYEGTLYRTTGPAYNAPVFDPSRVSIVPVGNVRLVFSDTSNGTFTATFDGHTVTKPITRQVFASPTTLCR
jgi:hypothetical protein